MADDDVPKDDGPLVPATGSEIDPASREMLQHAARKASEAQTPEEFALWRKEYQELVTDTARRDMARRLVPIRFVFFLVLFGAGAAFIITGNQLVGLILIGAAVELVIPGFVERLLTALKQKE